MGSEKVALGMPRAGSPGSGSDSYAVHPASKADADDRRHDAVFGDLEEGGPDYRNVSRPLRSLLPHPE